VIISPVRFRIAELRIAALKRSNSSGVALRKAPRVSGQRRRDNSSVSIRDGFGIVLAMQLTFVLVLEKRCFFDGFSPAPDAVLVLFELSSYTILIEDEDSDSTELAEVLPDIASGAHGLASLAVSEVGTTKDEDD
jgi:hypothetical protein